MKTVAATCLWLLSEATSWKGHRKAAILPKSTERNQGNSLGGGPGRRGAWVEPVWVKRRRVAAARRHWRVLFDWDRVLVETPLLLTLARCVIVRRELTANSLPAPGKG